MKALLYAAVVALTASSSGNASGWGAVAFDEMHLISSAKRIEIHMKSLFNTPEITIRRDGKDWLIDPKYLPNVKDIDAESIRLLFYSFLPSAEVAPQDNTDFHITFSFGGTYEHGKDAEGEIVLVTKALKLVFKDGQFDHSIVCIPKGNFENRWRYVEIYSTGTEPPDDGDLDLEKEFFEYSIRCPWEPATGG